MRTGDLETPIFHGAGRRLPWLRAAAIAAGALVVLWLAALVAGVVGFGAVSGLSLPGVDGPQTPVLHHAPGPLRSRTVRAHLAGAPALAARRRAATAESRRRFTGGGTGAGGAFGSSSASPASRVSPVAAHRGASRRGSSTSSGAATGGGAPTGTVGHGRGVGQSSSGRTTSSSPSSSSHRSTAPGRTGVKPAGGSPNSRANRTNTLG